MQNTMYWNVAPLLGTVTTITISNISISINCTGAQIFFCRKSDQMIRFISEPQIQGSKYISYHMHAVCTLRFSLYSWYDLLCGKSHMICMWHIVCECHSIKDKSSVLKNTVLRCNIKKINRAPTVYKESSDSSWINTQIWLAISLGSKSLRPQVCF